MSENQKSCIVCRLMSGTGLIGGGIYVIYHTKSLAAFSKIGGGIFGGGLCVLGGCRILDLPPFRKEHSVMRNIDVQNEDKKVEDEYIVGKLPKKWH